MLPSNLNELSTDHLDFLRDQLTNEIASLKSQLEHHKLERREKRQYRDNQWFLSASHALRMKGAEHQIILRELGRRSREAKLNRTYEEAIRFQNAARILLSRDKYIEILEAANAEPRKA